MLGLHGLRLRLFGEQWTRAQDALVAICDQGGDIRFEW